MKTTLESAKPEPQAIATSDPNQVLLYALDKGASVDVIERMMIVRKQLREEEAESLFDKGMSEFQAECPAITKDKAVPTATGKVAYKYAPIEAIEIQIRPYCKKHGFSHTYDTETDAPEGWVITKCIVRHVAGHHRIATGKFPLGTKTNMMSDTQQYASALTFSNRRALANAYGLILVGEDLDGATGKPQRHGPSALKADKSEAQSLVEELWGLLAPIRGSDRNWKQANQWLIAECVLSPEEQCPHLSVERFKEVIKQAKAKL